MSNVFFKSCFIHSKLLFFSGRMFEGSATTMLSSLDTVSSLSEDTLLWPGRKHFSVSLFWCVVLQPDFCKNTVFFPEVYGNVSNAAMGMGVIVFCLLAVSQVTSVQRTTFSLPLRSSPTTLSGKTSISGCCCSEARNCAQ